MKKKNDNSVLFSDEAEEASDAETEVEEDPETEPEAFDDKEDDIKKSPPTPPINMPKKKMPKVKTEKKNRSQ